MKVTRYISKVLSFNCLPWTFFLVFLLVTLNFYSQKTVVNDSLRIKYFTLEDGLSQVSNNDLLKDKYGFVWIATEDGLNRFDGNEFKHFKHSETDSMTISGNSINKLLEDKTEKLWIGTIGNGLNYYDKSLEIFHRIKLKYSQDENEIITGIVEDKSGAIWLTSQISGLHQLKPFEEQNFTQKNYLNNQSLTALHYSSDDKLWIGDILGNVYQVNPFAEQFLQKEPLLNVESQVRAFYITDQYLFIGSNNGLYIYDLQSHQLQLFELDKNGDFSTQFVSVFKKANEFSIWIGTGSGLYLFDWKNMSVLQRFDYLENSDGGLSNSTVLSILKISDNQTLVGTAKYLNLLDFSNPYFKNISKDQKGVHLLNDNIVFSIFKEGNDLWIGTSDGGLNLIRDGKSYYFREDKNNPTSISGMVVRAIVKDEINQRLWLATTRGLSMIDLNNFNPKYPKFTVFHHDLNNINTISDDFLRDIVLDKNNNLWGATNGKGIFRLELSNQNKLKVTRYKNQNDNPNSLRNNTVQSIKVDKENNIWIGTQGGLTKLNFNSSNYNKPVFTNYYRDQNLEKSLSHNSVYDILIDNEDRIWVSTRNGLNLFLGDNEFESWTEQNQFPNTVVYSIQDDEEGNLWLGTNDGIVKFNIDEREFMHYGLEDGIQSKEFDTHAKFRDTKGNIYLGGIGGLTYFSPKDLKNIDRSKSIYFSELRVKEQVIHPNNSSNNLLERSILNTNYLKIKHNQFPFYLQFSSIDFRLNKDVEYAYKLLPTDEEWNVLKDPEIQFLNLPVGSYTLQVNGFSRGKEWEQSPLEMNLQILPPWWATWWAYLIYLGIVVFFADRFYRFQLSKKLAVAESVRLKEVSQLKNSLYTNITHEFRTPLTVILGMADSLKSNVENKHLKGAEHALEMIRRNGKNLLRLVNEMLDLSKLESGNMKLQLIQADVIPFVKYLSESFHSLAEEKQINLTVYSEIDALMMDFDLNKLSVIISNLLSNAIKFTQPGGKIIVHLNSVLIHKKSFLFIKVKDNGLGISNEEIHHIFNRFYQVNNSSSYREEGTGIGLALTKEFVELMNGTIAVKSLSGKGSEFIIQLPITNDANKTKNIQMHLEPNVSSSTLKDNIIQRIPDDKSKLPLALIIEDNADVVHYLNTCLIEKYQTIYAVNGEIGIEMAYEKIPDIIICDVMMPVKNGFEVCSTLKADERTDHIPIILLTAKVALKDRLVGLSCGADAYLTKPFVKAELLTRLDQLVLLRKKMMQKIENDSFSQFLNNRAENPETKFLQKIIKIIHDEISNHSFGSSLHLSHKMHLSESQIYRKLKAITGKSTAVFIRSVRLQKAKELIQTTDKSISEIAYDVGFNDPSWFSRAFKEEFGFAPSAITK